MRPMRETLWRASNEYHLPLRKASNQAAHADWRRVRRHADIAQISSAIAGRHVHRPAHRNREMGEVATDADPLVEGAGGGAEGARELVVEPDAVVDEVANCLDEAGPAANPAELDSRRNCSERRCRNSGWASEKRARRSAVP